MSEENTSSNKDSISNVIVIALGVCLFCAVVVAGSAVALKERRVENKALDKSKNVLIAAGLFQENVTQMSEINTLFEQFEQRVVDLRTKRLLTADEVAVVAADNQLKNMLGSVSQLNTDGHILFIEEIGEYKYHIDRMLRGLKRAGYFNSCKGLIIGDISNIKKNTTVWGASIEDLVLDVVSEFDFPVLFNFPAGHETDNRALIFGKSIKMNVKPTISEVIFK